MGGYKPIRDRTVPSGARPWDDVPAVVVLEPTARWTSHLRRHLADEVDVSRCAAVHDLDGRLVDRRGRLVVLDLAVDPAGCLRWLAQRRVVEGLSVIVLTQPVTARLEWLARELGATTCLDEGVAAERMVRLCRRLLAVQPSSAGVRSGPAATPCRRPLDNASVVERKSDQQR